MAETLASLIDKLMTVSQKLWWTQDKVHKAATIGDGLDAETVQKLATFNLQRNQLMNEIDEAFAGAIRDGIVTEEPRIKIL